MKKKTIPQPLIKLLHTSDWHIGQLLYGKKRYEEFESFLSWLAELLEKENIDILLVAGDIFDTTTPSNRAQELYYNFLSKVSRSCCRHVVIIAGNHDSATLLEAPKSVLRALNVHVVGSVTETFEDEVLVLKDDSGAEELIICAVPYLKDRDIRISSAGESIGDKEAKIKEGIRDHYKAVCALAKEKQKTLFRSVPLVVMGHLFAAGGKKEAGDGVRDLYIGSLAQITADIFPPETNYVALGHLHSPQKVSGSGHLRYCGSPLPMGFGETSQEKSVCVVEFADKKRDINTIPIPTFQKLRLIRGDLTEIKAELDCLQKLDESVWLEMIYNGEQLVGDLREQLEAMVSGTKLDLLRVKNERIEEQVIQRFHEEESLDELTVEEVFTRCLDANQVPDEQRPGLLQTYQEILRSLQEADPQAE